MAVVLRLGGGGGQIVFSFFEEKSGSKKDERQALKTVYVSPFISSRFGNVFCPLGNGTRNMFSAKNLHKHPHTQA